MNLHHAVISVGEIDYGDAPAWVAVVVAVLALIISAVSAAFAWKSLRWERLSAEAAVRSAEAAERANLAAAERVSQASLETLSRQLAIFEDYGRANLATQLPAGDQTAPDDEDSESAPNVQWELTNPSKNRYVLRNVGTDIAEHVEVDDLPDGVITRRLPKDAVIRPQEGTDLLLMGTFGHPIPNQLYIRWAGHPDWQAVPIRT